MTHAVRVELPQGLRVLARIGPDLRVNVDGPVTIGAILDALETRYPMLRGTMRDRHSKQRRAFMRFFACQEDWSFAAPDAALPEAIASGAEPFMVVGAIAGG